jgi:hypothetical protein
MKIKILLMIILEKLILAFEFLWATWWAWIVILVGIIAIQKYIVTSETRYLFGILAILVGASYVVYEWKDYLKKYGNRD